MPSRPGNYQMWWVLSSTGASNPGGSQRVGISRTWTTPAHRWREGGVIGGLPSPNGATGARLPSESGSGLIAAFRSGPIAAWSQLPRTPRSGAGHWRSTEAPAEVLREWPGEGRRRVSGPRAPTRRKPACQPASGLPSSAATGGTQRGRSEGGSGGAVRQAALRRVPDRPARTARAEGRPPGCSRRRRGHPGGRPKARAPEWTGPGLFESPPAGGVPEKAQLMGLLRPSPGGAKPFRVGR